MFPGESILPPGGYLVLACEAALPSSSTNTGFGLAAEGESLHLFDAGGQLLDTVTFGLQAADKALARLPEAPATWRLALPTPGAQAVELADRPAPDQQMDSRSVVWSVGWLSPPTRGPRGIV
jgi:hypothetical protein